MQIIIDAYKKTKHLHHAYLIEGERQAVFAKLSIFLKEEIGVESIGNPDFWHGEFEKFGIDEGRQLKDLQSKRGVTGLPRVFIISTHFFTKEAQNALLKVFEEPTENTHFFLITSSAENILPTLKSRLFIVSDESISNISQECAVQADKFLHSNIAERIKIIKPLIENKDKVKTIAFLDALETLLYQTLRKGNPCAKGPKGPCSESEQDPFEQGLPLRRIKYDDIFNDIIKCRSYLYGNASSVKMILEHLAITAPRL